MNNSSPTISFVTPTYNANRCIERCLKSIRNQDYPQDKIEIIVADGGSTDNTIEIAKKYGAKIYDNPRKLAEFGLTIAVQKSSGDFLILAASDNELIGNDWLKRMLFPFIKDKKVSAEWGKMKSSKDDCSINHYYALIQNDPLTFFINKNLKSYVENSKPVKEKKNCYYAFNVLPDTPLPWGANCLVYRSSRVKHLWERSDYIGDNDVFQMMLEAGYNRVAYNPDLTLYHHTVGNIFDWVRKWKRNLMDHFLTKRRTRNLNWAYVRNFKIKVIVWFLYSIFMPAAFFHSLLLAIKNRDKYWMYHFIVTFAQAVTYSCVVLTTREGRRLIYDFMKTKTFTTAKD